MPRGKALRESHRSLDPLDGKHDTAATARKESARACPHSRQGLTPLRRLQKYPKIHVSTGEECSGSGTDSTQDLRPRHQLERNPERPPSNSHGVWPCLEWGHARALSSQAVAAVSRFPSPGSRDQGLSLEAFPRGFPTRLSHRAVPRATMV